MENNKQMNKKEIITKLKEIINGIELETDDDSTFYLNINIDIY